MSRRRHSYPLCHRSEPALLRHALGEVDSHLHVDHTPVLPPAGPLLRDVHHGQIQHFQQAVVGGEHGFGFGHLAQLAVEALDGIGGVNQPPHLLRVLEIGAQVCPVVPLCTLLNKPYTL